MMIKTKIAGINTKFDTDCRRLVKNLEAFRHDFKGEPEIQVRFTDRETGIYRSKYGFLDRDSLAFRYSSECFFNSLPEYSGFGVKASTVSLSDRAFAVLCDGGASGNQYVEKLMSFYPETELIDGSFSAIVREDSGVFVYGTPWAKKPVNQKMNLSAVVFPLDTGTVRPAERKEIFDRMSVLLPVPKRKEQLGTVFALIESISAAVPFLAVPFDDPGTFCEYAKTSFNG